MAEVRPIDANALKATIVQNHHREFFGSVLWNILDDMPTIEAEPVLIVLRKNGVYDVYVGKQEILTISRLSPDNIFSWLAKQRAVDIRFVDETIPNCVANMDGGKGNA